MRLSIPVRLLFLFLCVLLATQPALPAQPPAQRAAQVAMPDRFLAAGETYLDGVATALGRGLELQQQVTALHTARDAGGYAVLAEADLLAAQQTALDLAGQSATAAGAVTPLVTTITDLGHTAPDPLDLAALATDGLPASLRANLEDPTRGPGLDQATIAALDTAFKQQITRQHDLARSALPTAQRQALQALGLEAAEIDQIAAVMAAQGLAQPGLTDRRAQFAATQAELATTRTQALVTAVRLVTTAVLVRQAQGQFSRAVTADELAALADDELRLLLHIQQVQALADTDTAGAGHWWMIQRHATRAAERLERIIRESHNLALVGDLFVLRYLATLPLMAQAGDPDAARADLAAPAALLTYALQGRGAPAAAGGPEPATAGKGAGLAQPDAAAIAAAVAHLRTRLDAPQAQTTGQFAETDEVNNQVGLHLLVGLPDFGDIGADILAATLAITRSVSAEEVWTVFVAIVTGDTEDPALLVATILFSFLPVVGAIPDIYTLFVDPGIFVKALSIIGIVGSIGDLLALLGVTAPLAGAAFLGDASVALIKPLARDTPDALVVLDRLNIEQAFTVGGDLILVGVDELIVLDRGLGSSLDEAVGIVQDVFTGATRIWDDFGALTARSGPDLLLELGITPGSLLTGRVLRQGSDLAPESMRAVTNIGNDLDEIADVGQLSDEAASRLARLTDSVGDEGRMRRVLEGAGCVLGSVAASPALEYPSIALFEVPTAHAQSADCPNIASLLQQIYNWDEAAADGWLKLTNQVADEENLGRLLARYDANPATLERGLHVLNQVDIVEWQNASEATIGTMCDFIVTHSADDYTRALLERMTTTRTGIGPEFDIQFRGMLGRLDTRPELRAMIDPSVPDEIRNGMIEMLRRADHPDTPFAFRRGWVFQMDRAQHYYANGSGKLRAVEYRDTLNNQDVTYDFLLDDLRTGDVVEVKFWRATTFANRGRLNDFVQQIKNYTADGRFVTVELGVTARHPVTQQTVQNLYTELANADVPIDQVRIVIRP
jgi:hypothetical protein